MAQDPTYIMRKRQQQIRERAIARAAEREQYASVRKQQLMLQKKKTQQVNKAYKEEMARKRAEREAEEDRARQQRLKAARDRSRAFQELKEARAKQKQRRDSLERKKQLKARLNSTGYHNMFK